LATAPPPPSPEGTVVIAVQAFIALLVILLSATAAIILFVRKTGHRIDEAKSLILDELKRTERDLSDKINNIENNVKGAKNSKIE
jgi:hypothetical protein